MHVDKTDNLGMGSVMLQQIDYLAIMRERPLGKLIEIIIYMPE